MEDWDLFDEDDETEDEWPWWAQIIFVMIAGSGIWFLIALIYLLVMAWLF